MIFFQSFLEDRRGINFSTDENCHVVVKVVDGYTGLTVFQDEMDLSPACVYFYSHGGRVELRSYEIWNADQSKLLLKINTTVENSISLKNFDKFSSLKDFKYTNLKDRDPGLPLYEIFHDRIYEKYFQVEEEDTVVDIGGNIGIFSYYALCKGARKVYCFEPSEEQFSTIKNNFSFEKLIVENAAVTDKDGSISFFVNPSSSINSSILASKDSVEVICRSVNLENYLNSVGEKTINYLKMDCEGGEYSIFESLSEVFLKDRVEKMCVEYHHNYDKKILPIMEKLISCGFTVRFEHDASQINDALGIFYAWKQK
jgi:FkbM family methyltransferase